MCYLESISTEYNARNSARSDGACHARLSKKITKMGVPDHPKCCQYS